MGHSLFFGDLTQVVRPRSSKPGDSTVRERLAQVPFVKSRLFESLLLSDKVIIDLTGPALEAVLLLEWLGPRLLEELVEEDAIGFSLCPGTIAYLTQDNRRFLNIPDGPPLNIVMAREEGFKDQQGVFQIALKAQSSLSDRQIRRWSKRLAEKTTLLDTSAIHDLAITTALSDAGGPIGTAMGLGGKPLDDLNATDMRLLLDLTSSNRLFCASSESGCNDMSGGPHTWNILRHRFAGMKHYTVSAEQVGNILEFEGYPNVAQALLEGKLKFDRIAKLRQDPNIEAFRQWLAQVSQTATQVEVLKAYREAYEGVWSNSLPVKVARVGIITLVGSLLDSYVPGSGAVLGTIDAFLLDRVIRGWTPKIFIQRHFPR